MSVIYKIVLGYSALLLANFCVADSLHVAVASNFAPTMKELVQVFEQKTQHSVTLSFSSSGKIYAQILHGAPYDAFFSADQEKPAKLEALGLTAKESRFTYAEGALVLWAKSESIIGNNGTGLTNGKNNTIALANPKLAPYGAAAMEVLATLKLPSSAKNKIIMGENISQTYQFVRSGSADLGFLALSQVEQRNKDTKGAYWLIPKNLYRPIMQDAVIIKQTKHPTLTAEFFAFIKSETAKKIINEYGYGN